jgi:hypothetical protein
MIYSSTDYYPVFKFWCDHGQGDAKHDCENFKIRARQYPFGSCERKWYLLAAKMAALFIKESKIKS